MKNPVHSSSPRQFVAPAGGVVSGTPVLIGTAFVIPVVTASAAATFAGETEGIFTLPKTTSQAWVDGDPLYWVVATSKLSNVAGAGPMVATAYGASASAATTGKATLIGLPFEPGFGVQSGSPTPTSKAAAGAIALTAAETLSGVLVVDCGGAARTVTLPDADVLVAAVPGAKVGDMIRLYVVNGSDAAEAITIAAGTGGALDANQVSGSEIIGQNTSKLVHVRLTNVTAASEAYVVYV